MTALRCALALLVLLLAGCAGDGPPSASGLVRIPLADPDGRAPSLVARLCRPAPPGALPTGPLPVAIINHGAPPDSADRTLMQPASCDSEPARWFTARGYLVVFALRRGFGASSGPVAESSGPCAEPDYRRAGDAGARDVAAIVAYATHLPDARRDGVVVVGQSTGGWATLAYAGLADPGVAALVSMAGGRGGRAGGTADAVCRPDLLDAAAAGYGAQARRPMLWVYAANDHEFPPAMAAALQDAFVGGGGQAELQVTAPYGSDGHQLLFARGGSSIWGGLLDAYLAQHAQPPQIPMAAAPAMKEVL